MPNRNQPADKTPSTTPAYLGKLPPQSIEAEQSLLGALLIDKDAISVVAEMIRADHFYKSEQHGNIFSAILELFEKREPIDLVTVSEQLRQKKLLDRVGGSAYLTELMSMVPTAAHVETYAKIIRQRKGNGIRVGDDRASGLRDCGRRNSAFLLS